ncbi:glycosyltransferase family 39 protein [Pseudomonas sp. MUP55]|uniref:glycosyltransferase family 39 protein n=1 Tax=Pseudomonas sp. MUP55 TaxID=3087234 RepID=UPI002A5A4076|nr:MULTISPECIES: glycosyltransferase family 39 protein [unclassified Pseudomonas]WPN93874.1 glycosyltransferase family 39 protein [Pseudomonas sp. MUP56]WPN99400.1 glycosyltransferase family 39 protein [Pseudomonas sp. MUP55]
MKAIRFNGTAWIISWLFIIGLATAIRFYRLSDPSVWADEAFSVLLSRHSPAFIWVHTAFDVHPPFYYELLHYWMMLWGDSPFAVRSMSAVMGVVGVALGIWLTELAANRKAAVWAGVMLAILPITVRYSQEARMYALMASLMFASTIALFCWVRQPSKYRFLVVYVLLMSAGFYTHYFSAICVVAHWCYMGLLGARGIYTPVLIRRLAWWLANVAIIVAYSPWLYTLWDRLSARDVVNQTGSMGWIAGVTLGTLPSAHWRTLMAANGKALFESLYLGVPAVMFILAIGLVLKDRSRYQFPSALIIYTYVPLVLVFLLSLVKPMFMERYLFFSLMALPIVIVLLLESVPYKALKWGALLLFIALECVGLRTVYIQREDLDGNRNRQALPFDEMATYVAQSSMPGDRMVVEDGLWYFSVLYYNELPSLPQLHRGIDSGLGSSTILMPSAAQVYLSDMAFIPEGNCRVWWLGRRGGSTVFPDSWQQLSERPMGTMDLRLFQTAPDPKGAVCPPPEASNDLALQNRVKKIMSD